MEASEEYGNQLGYFEMSGYCVFDCRDGNSIGIQKLCSIVKVSCLGLNRQVGDISACFSILVGVRERDFNERIVC